MFKPRYPGNDSLIYVLEAIGARGILESNEGFQVYFKKDKLKEGILEGIQINKNEEFNLSYSS